MGHVREKYTRRYFLGGTGKAGAYGVEGLAEYQQGKIRAGLEEILDRLDFAKAHVLELGFGRGEVIKYALERGAADYVGVDFSDDALRIAEEHLEKHGLPVPKLYCEDALEFLQANRQSHEVIAANSINVVVMFDFIEHVPRQEMSAILDILRDLLAPNAVLAVNTPLFKFDNDVIKDGLDQANLAGGLDLSDLVHETTGMHCNKYTLVSLNDFFKGHQYQPLGQAHFFIPNTEPSSAWSPLPSYRKRWEDTAADRPLAPEWKQETIRFVSEDQANPVWHALSEGHLKGIKIYLSQAAMEVYSDGFSEADYPELVSELRSEARIFFDVGGHTGLTSMLFAKFAGPDGTVCAFEPNPWNLDRLRLNLSQNQDLAERVQVYEMALSNLEAGESLLMSQDVDRGYSSTSRLASSHCGLNEQQIQEIGLFSRTIFTTTLDNFVERTGLVPDVIKIDVEGAEHLVLEGAQKILRTASPLLLIELHSPFCALACESLLRKAGYSFNLVREENDGRLHISATKNDGEPVDDSTAGALPLCEATSRWMRRYVTQAEQQNRLRELENKELSRQLDMVLQQNQTLLRLMRHPVRSLLGRLKRRLGFGGGQSLSSTSPPKGES